MSEFVDEMHFQNIGRYVQSVCVYGVLYPKIRT